MIHVCYAANTYYFKFVGASMASIFENTNSAVTIHILHDSTLSQDDREKLIYLTGKYQQQIQFYDVEKLCAEKLGELRGLMGRVGREWLAVCFYRAFIPDVLPAEIIKAIYLDSDTIANLDIRELWQVELGDKPIAAVIGKNEDYLLARDGLIKGDNLFNDGVIVLNLEKWRSESSRIFWDGMRFLFSIPKYYGLLDNDIMLYCFATPEQTVSFSEKFNCGTGAQRQNKINTLERAIYHYANSRGGEGWGLDTGDVYNRIFLEYFSKTPFFSAETISHLWQGIRKLHVERQNFAVKVSAMMSGKKRAFFVAEANIGALKQIFSIGDDEEIIPITSAESIVQLMNSMQNSQMGGGTKVFFLFVGNYLQLSMLLRQNGFVEGRDFVNGYEFLSEAHGIQFNPYPFVAIL